MEKQLIISVGREFGSGGHLTAVELAKRFSIPLYDNEILDKAIASKHITQDQMDELKSKHIRRYDEAPRDIWISRTVRGYSNSVEENLARIQFEYLKKLAASGESFVVVGRCAESVLKGHPALVSIFVLGDMEQKIKRISALHNISEDEAETMIQRMDKRRKNYHNYYCSVKWGDSRNYDLNINSSRLGLAGTADLLEQYIRARLAARG